MNTKTFRWLFWTIVTVGLALRLVDLGRRPMHHQEAQQAARLAPLLENGRYPLDRREPQGPGLAYFSYPLARAVAGRDFAALNETALRLVPALFGVGLILLFLLLVEGMGRRAVLLSAAAAALSPAVTTYSRFYLPEILSIFFLTALLASLWRAFRRPSAGWALAAGIFAGLMYATGVGTLLALGAAGGALLAVWAITDRKPAAGNPGKRRPLLLWLLGLLAALITSYVLYSHFFRNPEGWLDSWLSLKTHFLPGGKPGQTFSASWESLKMLVLSRCKTGVIWSEAFILFLALAGGFASFKVKGPENEKYRFSFFVLFYTCLAILAYSFLPLPKPEPLLPIYFGFILLAGRGASAILEGCRTFLLRTAILMVLAAGFIHLGVQNIRANFQFAEKPCQPYIQSATGPEIKLFALRVKQLSRLHPDGSRLPIRVMADAYDAEILSWYLRGFSQARPGLEVDRAVDGFQAPLVISSNGQGLINEWRLPAGYHTEFFQLRPGKQLCLAVRPDLWEIYQRRQNRLAPDQTGNPKRIKSSLTK
jgi:uncharacterized protein (TIGR03663 family)